MFETFGLEGWRELERLTGEPQDQEKPDLRRLAGMAELEGRHWNAAGARDLYAALLPVAERVLGPQHDVTRQARAGLVRWTG
jgi:hypothetical protein